MPAFALFKHLHHLCIVVRDKAIACYEPDGSGSTYFDTAGKGTEVTLEIRAAAI